MDEYIQYHNPQTAELLLDPHEDYSIYTDKPATKVPGARIWLITRDLLSDEYRLVYWFIAEKVIPGRDGQPNVVVGKEGDAPNARIDAYPWFASLRRQTGNFAFGLQRITNVELIRGLRAVIDKTERSFSQAEISPIIGRLILSAFSQGTQVMSHDAIVAALLADDEGATIVARAKLSGSWSADSDVATSMVAWFSQKITMGESTWGESFDRERQDGKWAYRIKTDLAPFIGELPNSALEGEPRWVFHVRRERDPVLARAKRDEVQRTCGQLRCEACGLIATNAYPGLAGDIYEVHHRRPLADAAEAAETRLADLALLCANCHRAIHRTKPLLSVDGFRASFFPKS